MSCSLYRPTPSGTKIDVNSSANSGQFLGRRIEAEWDSNVPDGVGWRKNNEILLRSKIKGAYLSNINRFGNIHSISLKISIA